MTRVLFVGLALIAFPLGSRAEETVVRLNVRPMPAPRPALKYLLLPEVQELNPGNPIPGYLRCFMEQQHFFFDKASVGRREKLLAMPLQELAAQDLREYGGAALRQADWAARLDNPDWQILLQLKTDGYNTLLPDVQELRSLVQALKVRFRAEVAQRRFDDALRTAKTMFAIARHLSEHPCFICDLVAMAFANVAIGPLEEMLEQPGCPNLYWALTNLPTPLVPLEKALEGERVMFQAAFRGLDERIPMSEVQLKKLIAQIDELRKLDTGTSRPDRSVRTWLDARTKDAGLIRAARCRLVEVGLSEERLLGFPADQVILLDEKREDEVRRDDVLKIISLPIWQTEAIFIDQAKPNKDQTLIDLGIPLMQKTRLARGRLEQRFALLRHVEALRMYAAEHDGRLPGQLSDVPVPLPDDPFTGKPFPYKVAGATALIRGTPPRGFEKGAAYNVHYAVTIQNVRDESTIQK